MKLIGQTLSGIFALVAGVTLMYLFFTGLSKGANYIFLIPSIILIGAGAYLFIRVSNKINADPQQNNASTQTETGSKLLEKNNQMIEDWGKVNTKKDGLKAIQIAANAQAQKITEENK